jgi:UDP-N-acetylmuramoyl-L-alanyl-D-glutamate--2,6-diaminopimelate ligase
MEASSHALHQHRLTGVQLKGALFTNITHDHLDYHKTFNDYIKAKKILFDTLPSSAFAIVNHDDRHSEVMLQNCKARKKTMALAKHGRLSGQSAGEWFHWFTPDSLTTRIYTHN